MEFNISKIYLIERKNLIFCIFCTGIVIAYWGSLLPWFMWPFAKLYVPFACLLLGTAWFLSTTQPEEYFFNREDTAIPLIAAILLYLYQRLVNDGNIIGCTEALLNVFVVFMLMKIDIGYLQRTATVLCKVLGTFLVISMGAFLLYIFGFPLPSSSIINEELMYSYTNFYFFLIDDRMFLMFLPRFQSVFLEPGHLGTAAAFLLMLQIGHWKRWYNIVLIIASLLTFSLAAYVLLVLIAFLGAWIVHKEIFAKLAITIVVLGTVLIGSLFYNEGDNLVNNLIIDRLAIEDGKLVGDNRVTDKFGAAYDDFVKTSDVWFGRDYTLDDFGFGNAGYRVFIYDNGLIGLLLVLMFYYTATVFSPNRRARIAMLLIGSAAFWVRATPITYYFLMPLYMLPYIYIRVKKKQNGEEK